MKTHHVLDDAVAERMRGSIWYKVRAAEWTPEILVFCFVLFVSAAFVFSSSRFEQGISFWLIILCLAGIFYFTAAGWLLLGDDLEPLTDSYGFRRLTELADKHAEVAAFVAEAIENKRTLRKRDLIAAERIDRLTREENIVAKRKADVELARNALVESRQPRQPIGDR